jgi:hypothetical protein
VWDNENGQPAKLHKAVVDQIDGFDGTATVVVGQGVAHLLSQNMRDGTGESVTLKRDGTKVRLTEVHGRAFALAAMQYLQGGMTTRLSDGDAGVDIQGVDSGQPGVYLYDSTGSPTVIIDAETGDASFIGEIGTALPGDMGVFLYSVTFQTLGNVTVTHPVAQFNVQASRDQPSIQADVDPGSGSPELVWYARQGRHQANGRHLGLPVPRRPGRPVRRRTVPFSSTGWPTKKAATARGASTSPSTRARASRCRSSTSSARTRGWSSTTTAP